MNDREDAMRSHSLGRLALRRWSNARGLVDVGLSYEAAPP